MRWSEEQVTGLAPDAKAVRAARGLAVPRPWSDAGCDERAVWGACQGSGATAYDTAVDLAGPAYRCTCPSRKIPCKHVLGLLLLWSGGAVQPAEAPAWVTGWLTERDERAERSRSRPADRDQADDPAADAERAAARRKRAADREARIGQGLTELDRWLRDLVRAGLAGAPSQPYAFWDGAAARMVDAQAPGVASSLRRLAGIVHGDERWPDRLLGELGRLHLVTTAWPRREGLPDAARADVRTAVGWPVPTEEVLGGPRVRDRWAVLARTVSEEERLRAQRTYLRGRTGRPALVLDFAPAGGTLPADLVPGSELDADLVFYPGSVPLRALVADRHASPRPLSALPAAGGIDDVLAEAARVLAANPWLDRLPVALDAVIPVRRGERWYAHDGAGTALPLDPRGEAAWVLHAVAGGRPVGLVGEWTYERLVPLAVWADERLVGL